MSYPRHCRVSQLVAQFKVSLGLYPSGASPNTRSAHPGAACDVCTTITVLCVSSGSSCDAMSPPQVPGEPVSTAIWSGTVLASGETVPYYESLHCWVCFHAYIPAAALSHNDQNAEKTPRGKDGTMEFWITSVRCEPTPQPEHCH